MRLQGIWLREIDAVKVFFIVCLSLNDWLMRKFSTRVIVRVALAVHGWCDVLCD